MEKGEYYLNFGNCHSLRSQSWLKHSPNELLKLNEYQRSGSFFDLCQRSLDFKIKTCFFFRNSHLKPNFLLVVLLFFWTRLIVFVSVVSICLVCNFSIVATCPSIQLPVLLFVCVLFLLFVDVLSGEEPRQN